MKKPTEPIKPRFNFPEPVAFYEKYNFIDFNMINIMSIDSSVSCGKISLKDIDKLFLCLKSQLPKNVTIDDLYFGTINSGYDDYEYLSVYYITKIKNNTYKSDLKRYKKSKIKYDKDFQLYEENMKIYLEQKLKYDICQAESFLKQNKKKVLDAEKFLNENKK